MNYPELDEPDEPAEVFEHIPWAELALPVPEKKPWVIYLCLLYTSDAADDRYKV